jgi:hypothetical protein
VARSADSLVTEPLSLQTHCRPESCWKVYSKKIDSERSSRMRVEIRAASIA